MSLDLRTRRASVGGGEAIELSAREFALLELFLRHPDQVLSREQLLARVWGYDFDPGSNVVEVYVGYLRRKLGPEHIEHGAWDGLPLHPGLVVLVDAQDLAGAGVDVHVGVVREADGPHELAVVAVEVGVGEVRAAGARRGVAQGADERDAGLVDRRCRGRRGASW